MNRTVLSILVGGLLLGFVPLTQANDADLAAEVQALRAEVAQLRADQGDTWLNERRAEEVKSLIHEVLQDADTRAALLQDGAYAGHNGKNFFLQSPEGDFLMTIAGQIQMRAIWNYHSEEDETAPIGSAGAPDGDDFGFQMRRIKLKFKGHVASPKIKYNVVLATDRGDGNVFVEDAVMSYDLTDNLTIKGGKYKLPFLRQELNSSTRFQAVERALVTEYFTLDRAEQVGIVFEADMFKVEGSFSDGSNSEFSSIGSDASEIALTARGNVKISGDWKQMKDFTSWSGEEMAIFAGAAVHYETGDAANGGFADYFAFTIDGSFEMNGLSVFGAFTWGDIDPDTGFGSSFNPWSILVQGGYNINDTIEPFIRWEYLDFDTTGANELQAFTFGANYFLNKHNAKFTADVVWIYDGPESTGTSNPFGSSITSSGLGWAGVSAFNDDIFLLRGQFQLLF